MVREDGRRKWEGSGGGKGKYEGKNTAWPKDRNRTKRNPNGLFRYKLHATSNRTPRSRTAGGCKATCEDAEREAFFNKQIPTSTAPSVARVSAPKQQTVVPTTPHAGGHEPPERYAALNSASARVKKMPQAGWNAPASEKQTGYLGSLNDRARLNTTEGSAYSDVWRMRLKHHFLKMTKWEACNRLTQCKSQGQCQHFINQRRIFSAWRANGRARPCIVFASELRLALIITILSQQAAEEGLPF